MYELDITRKLSGDNLKGIIIAGDTELYANVDAATIYEAMAYMDEASSAIDALKKNPENPALKNRAGKAGLNIYKALRLIYDDEEYEKIKRMNVTTKDLGVLVEAAIKLFNNREEQVNSKN